MRRYLVAASFFLMVSAQAAPVTWYVNATFTPYPDGANGRMTGSFDYDAATSAFTNVNITTSCVGGCSDYLSHTITQLYSGWPDYQAFSNYDYFAAPQDRQFEVTLTFARALTSGQSTIALSVAESYISDYCYNNCPVGAKNYSATLSGTVSTVPLPAAVWLFMSGLGVLGFARKKRA